MGVFSGALYGPLSEFATSRDHDFVAKRSIAAPGAIASSAYANDVIAAAQRSTKEMLILSKLPVRMAQQLKVNVVEHSFEDICDVTFIRWSTSEAIVSCHMELVGLAGRRVPGDIPDDIMALLAAVV